MEMCREPTPNPRSKEAVGIDVDIDLERAALLDAAKPAPQESLHVGVAAGLDEKPPAIATAHQGDRRRRRPQDMNGFGAWCAARQRAGEFLGLARIRTRHDDRRKSSVGRQPRRFADSLLLGK